MPVMGNFKFCIFGKPLQVVYNSQYFSLLFTNAEAGKKKIKSAWVKDTAQGSQDYPQTLLKTLLVLASEMRDVSD